MFRIRNLPDALLRYQTDASQGGDGSGGGDGSNSQSSNQGNQSSNQQSSSQGQGDNSQQSAPQVAPGQGSGQAEIPQGLASMISKHQNDALKVAEILHGDNYNLREKNRQLQAQIDGAVILRDANKTAYEQYQALGAPSDIASKLRQGEIERVAGRAGYNAQVLSDLDRMAGGKLTYEVKTEAVDGQNVERVYVKDNSDATAQPQLLDEYAAAKWAAYLPALQPQSQSQGQGSGGNGNAPGTRFPTQHPGGTGGHNSPDIVAKFQQEQVEKNAAVTNPLLKS